MDEQSCGSEMERSVRSGRSRSSGLRKDENDQDSQMSSKSDEYEEVYNADGELMTKQLKKLSFANPGKFMEDFDPERSNRELRKVNRRIYSENMSPSAESSPPSPVIKCLVGGLSEPKNVNTDARMETSHDINPVDVPTSGQPETCRTGIGVSNSWFAEQCEQNCPRSEERCTYLKDLMTNNINVEKLGISSDNDISELAPEFLKTCTLPLKAVISMSEQAEKPSVGVNIKQEVIPESEAPKHSVNDISIGDDILADHSVNDLLKQPYKSLKLNENEGTLDIARKTAQKLNMPQSSVSHWSKINPPSKNEKIKTGQKHRIGRPISYGVDIDEKIASWVSEEFKQERTVSTKELCTYAQDLIRKSGMASKKKRTNLSGFKASSSWAVKFLKRHNLTVDSSRRVRKLSEKCQRDVGGGPENMAVTEPSTGHYQNQLNNDLNLGENILKDLSSFSQIERYKSFTLEEKQKAVELAKQIGIRKAAKQLDIPHASVSRWKRINFSSEDERNELGHLPKSGRPLTYGTEIDERIAIWVSEQCEHSLPISVEELCAYARDLVKLNEERKEEKLDLPADFKASNGWALKFLKRHDFSVHPKTKSIKKNQLYDESGRFIENAEDRCDCLEVDCPGCHFPCSKCGSEKCGTECRCARKWYYDTVEVEGTDIVIRWQKG